MPIDGCSCPLCEHPDWFTPIQHRHAPYHAAFRRHPARWGPALYRMAGRSVPAGHVWPEPEPEPRPEPAYPTYPPAPVRPPATVPGAVSIIVAARNYGRYLADALASALNQSTPALEVIYADDGSEDDSLKVARGFPGVIVLPGPHQGVAATRNRGCAVARGAFLLHLDGDDILPSNYLAARLAALQRDPEAAFAYGPAQVFGAGANTLWEVHDWAEDAPARLWVTNWINTSTLIRADAFRAVGGWREGIGTAWDWDLFLRLARAGYRGVADREGRLLYRRHPTSVSATDAAQDVGTGPPFQRNAYLERVSHARTAIGCVLSDRLLALLPTWLDALSATIRHHAGVMASERAYGGFGRIEPPAPSLHLLYTGDRAHLPAIHRALSAHLPPVGEFSLTHAPQAPLPTDRAARNHAVSTLLARLYNRLLRSMEADVAWWIEDDILVPPNALHDLKRALLAPTVPRPAVAGWYRSRHADPHLLAHDGGPGGIRVVPAITADEQPVDLTGTGCLMVFRPFAPHGFEPFADGTIPAHDWQWCRTLAASEVPPWQSESERKPVLIASVKCRHHRTVDDAVEVDAPSPASRLQRLREQEALASACDHRLGPAETPDGSRLEMPVGCPKQVPRPTVPVFTCAQRRGHRWPDPRLVIDADCRQCVAARSGSTTSPGAV